jgi:hypothetical protein
MAGRLLLGAFRYKKPAISLVLISSIIVYYSLTQTGHHLIIKFCLQIQQEEREDVT